MSLFEHPFGAMRLERYPPGAANDTLQAWDAADEYLLQACPSAQAITGPTLIFNDAFGALACALQGRGPFCISDSYLSQLATRHNLAQNTQGEQVTLLDSLAPLPPSPGLVLLKVPKTLALLEQQLHAVRQVAGPDTLFLAAGRVREIHRSTLALFSDIYRPDLHLAGAKKGADHLQHLGRAGVVIAADALRLAAGAHAVSDPQPRQRLLPHIAGYRRAFFSVLFAARG
ncbi:Ribosomal RNA large subunit methyltransferase G [Sodalis praecaptivus]|nr:Ribosomal RNA large subunit methyltransferase G [Sodalis praecaptivus]